MLLAGMRGVVHRALGREAVLVVGMCPGCAQQAESVSGCAQQWMCTASSACEWLYTASSACEWWYTASSAYEWSSTMPVSFGGHDAWPWRAPGVRDSPTTYSYSKLATAGGGSLGQGADLANYSCAHLGRSLGNCTPGARACARVPRSPCMCAAQSMHVCRCAAQPI